MTLRASVLPDTRTRISTERLAPVRSEQASFAPALFFLLPFVYLAYSRLTEVVILRGVRIQLILALTCLAFVLLSGRFWALLARKPGVWYVALTCWFLAAIPFSVWPGGSFAFVTESWYKSVLVFPLVAGLVRSPVDLRRLSVAFATAGVTVALLLFTFSAVMDESRVAVNVEGTLGNPNDAAAHMLFTLPYIWVIAYDRRRSAIVRTAAAVGVVLVLLACLKTGSRMGLVALLGMSTYAIVTSAPKVRFKVALGLLALCFAAVTTLPSVVVSRYLTTFSDRASAVDDVSTALVSRAGRIDLFWESVGLTLANPIFGVGPAMYQVASADLLKSEGKQAHWHETHNSYTQISSEAGIPALVFYLAILLAAFRGARKASRNGDPTIRPLAAAQTYSLLAYAFCSAFGSLAYHIYLPTLAGVSVAIESMHASTTDQTSQQQPVSAIASARYKGPPTTEVISSARSAVRERLL